LAVQHCYVGVTQKSIQNHAELEDTVCSNQVKVQQNKTSGHLADDVAEYNIR